MAGPACRQPVRPWIGRTGLRPGTSIRRGAPARKPAWVSGFGQVLVVAGGLWMGPDRGISFCAVVEPSNRLATE